MSSNRSQLIRSSKKVGAILGTTPLLLQIPSTPPIKHTPLTPTTRASRRAGRVYDIPYYPERMDLDEPVLINKGDDNDFLIISPDSPSSRYHYHSLSADDVMPSKPTPLPKPKSKRSKSTHVTGVPQPLLNLRSRLPPPPPPPLTSRLSVDTTSSSIASDPVPPVSPSAARRKKMAKLVRTLGESVPPELVLSQCTNMSHQSRTRSSSWSWTSSKEGNAKRLESAPSVPPKSIHAQKPLVECSYVFPPTPHHGDRPFMFTRASVSDPEMTTYFPIHAHIHCESDVDLVSSMVDSNLPGPRSISSAKSLHPLYRAQSDTRATTGKKSTHNPTLSAAYRKEREWSGEWNVDMNVAVCALRELKSR